MIGLLQTLVNALSIGATYALLGLGLSLVFSVLGLINFSYGAVVMWGGFGLVILQGLGLPFWASVALIMLGLVGISVLSGLVAFEPFRGAPPATLLLSSFGVTLILQAVAFLIFRQDALVVATPPWLSEIVNVGPLQVSVLQILTLTVTVILLLALQVLLYRTSLGLRIRAVAHSSEVSEILGVRAPRVSMIVFGLSGLIAGVVAFLWFAKSATVSSLADLSITLKAFIVVVVGGLGSLSGAVIGGLLVGLFEALLFAYLPESWASWQEALVFALITIVLIVRPTGLLGKLMLESK